MKHVCLKTPQTILALVGLLTATRPAAAQEASAPAPSPSPYSAQAAQTPPAAPPAAAAAPQIPVAASPAAAPAVVPVLEPAPAAPPPPAPPALKVTGNFWSRYEARAGQLALNALGGRGQNSDKVFYRARVGLSPAPVDLGHGYSSTFYFEPQATGFYNVGAGVGTDDLGVGLHQGFLKLDAPTHHWQVGRFEMVYGEHFVIGNVGWHQTGRAFNGGRVHITPSADSPWLDLFVTLNDDGADSVSDPHIGALDYYFVGAYAGLGPMLKSLEWDIYLLSKVYTGGTGTTEMGAVSVDPAAHVTVGSRVKGKADVVDYRLETGVQLGKSKASNLAEGVSTFAYQVDAELGVTPAAGLRLALGGFLASGDDPTTEDNEGWDQLFPTAHKFLGLTDIMGGRSNVAGGIARIGYGLSKTVNAGLDAHLFTRPTTPEGTDAYAGTELDFNLGWAIFPSLNLRGMYGLFMPSKDGPFGNDDLQHYLEIELAQTL